MTKSFILHLVLHWSGTSLVKFRVIDLILQSTSMCSMSKHPAVVATPTFPPLSLRHRWIIFDSEPLGTGIFRVFCASSIGRPLLLVQLLPLQWNFHGRVQCLATPRLGALVASSLSRHPVKDDSRIHLFELKIDDDCSIFSHIHWHKRRQCLVIINVCGKYQLSLS